MKTLVMVLGLLLVTPGVSEAGTFARYGIGIFRSADYGKGTVKSFSVGQESELAGPIISEWEGGLFADASGNGRKSSGFGNIGLGIQADPGYFVLRSIWAVGAITTPDSMLGGRFQFSHDLLVGVRGPSEAIIGVDLKHTSSAGLESPNIGRDFLLLHVELPF